MARLMMNVQFASGNYPWVIIRVEDRDQYMKALESASHGNNIEPFASYVVQLMRERVENKLAANPTTIPKPAQSGSD